MKWFAFIALFSCSWNALASGPLATGMWSAYLDLNDSTRLRFYFAVKDQNKKQVIEFRNGEERIIADEVNHSGDSLFIKMPVFDSEFRCKMISVEKMKNVVLEGNWINHARKNKNVLHFSAECYSEVPHLRSDEVKEPDQAPFVGKWEVTFSPGTPGSTRAIGLFEGFSPLNGTFLTETGDYRFLSGSTLDHNSFELSCFDGAHAFYFNGYVDKNGVIQGNFYSGSHWHEKWIAKRNDKFELRHPDSLTFLKPGFDKIDFKFKNLEGKTISLQDEKFKNKVVIVQLMGSWCPNCMDETKFLSELYKKYKTKNVEVIALAFEKDTAFAKAKSLLERLKKKYGIEYEILVTQKTGKEQASSALPMLNAVMAFPTTIFIDKKGRVRKIYTGFTGPGTGDHYNKLVDETTLFLDKLIRE